MEGILIGLYRLDTEEDFHHSKKTRIALILNTKFRYTWVFS